MKKVEMNIDAGKVVRSFGHFQRAFGYASVDLTYTDQFKRMYDYLSSYRNQGIYMRMHHICTPHGKGDFYWMTTRRGFNFPDPKKEPNWDIVVQCKDGKITYDWDVVDKVYDVLIEHGMHPIVETCYIPNCLRKEPADINFPADYTRWRDFIAAFTKHCQDRYGKEEIEKWYFEIWNEPDWVIRNKGTEQAFYALYDYMVEGVHSVNPNIKVGGPATMQGKEALDLFKGFLDHCTSGVNYANGGWGTRMDFMSVHCKGGNPESMRASINEMFSTIHEYLKIWQQYPQLKDTEFFNDESDVIWGGDAGIDRHSWLNFRNTHYFPGFVCKMINTYCDIVEDQYRANFTVVDSDNCHLNWEPYLFSGNRSQLTSLNKYPTTDQIRKPMFNAYVLLGKLGEKRLQVDSDAQGFKSKFGCLPTSANGLLSLMVWNFEDGAEDDINAREIKINIGNHGLTGKYKLVHWRIDGQHSSAYEPWRKMGKPDKPSVEQIAEMRKHEGLELYEPVKDIGMTPSLSFTLDMPMHSVSLLLLVPENHTSPAVPSILKASAETGFNGNPQVFLKWKTNTESDFLNYRIWRKVSGDTEYSVLCDSATLNTAVYVDMDVKPGSSYSYQVESINASGAVSGRSKEINVTTL